ncbi:MAG TPA: DUF6282 family protein [Devosia sp.]|nr:DUF6282 family protein [Devosia sp.]
MDSKIANLLIDAVDLHCHSGPAAMDRILDHYDAMVDARDAGFRALVYKDHFYPGMAHAKILQRLNPEMKLQLYSGLVLNNAVGGINPHAVDHALRLGAKIIWMPTLSAANHIEQLQKQGKTFPKTKQPMLDAIPLSSLDEAGKITDTAKQVLDLIAETDAILAGGHLHVDELHVLFEEAARRGVTRRLINHPTYLIGCSDADIKALVAGGTMMEHSICMFVEGRSLKYAPADLKHLIDVAGVDNTILSSDLGLPNGPRPVDGFRAIAATLIDLGYSDDEIKRLVGRNARKMLSLESETI